MRGAVWLIIFLSWAVGAYACLLDEHRMAELKGIYPPLPGVAIPLTLLCRSSDELAESSSEIGLSAILSARTVER